MAEREEMMDVVLVNMICDKCGLGKMLPENFTYPTYPVQYPHTCSHCGNHEVYYQKYPYQKLVPKTKEDSKND